MKTTRTSRTKRNNKKNLSVSSLSISSLWQNKVVALLFIVGFGLIGATLLVISRAQVATNCTAALVDCNFKATNYGKPLQATIDAVNAAKARAETNDSGNFGVIIGGVGIQSSSREKNPKLGVFSLSGGFSHSLPDDPIVFPGQPGASHMHDFIGNTTTNAHSTTQSLFGKASTALELGTYKGEIVNDAAAYWFPAVYQNGVKAKINGSTIYYRPPSNDLNFQGTVQPPPLGLKMIAGDAKSTTPSLPSKISWEDHCNPGNSTRDGGGMITSSCGEVRLNMHFQSWWDCRNLDSPDHKSHMSYVRTATHTCPLPNIQVFVRYEARGGSGFSLASGPWYTAHGDFFNAWDPALIRGLVNTIMNSSPRETGARLERAGPADYILTTGGGGTGDTTAPSVPSNVRATAVSSSQVNLTWNASTDNVGVTAYTISRNGVEIANTAMTQYNDTGVSPGGTYSYTVKARDAAGNVSAASTAASVTTPGAADTTAPSAPSNLAANAVSTSQINLTWSASTDNVGVTGYQVFRNNVMVATINSTSYGDGTLSAGTTYSYYVKARDAAGNVSMASATVSATTQNVPPPPTVQTGTLQGNVRRASGDPLPGATGKLTVNGVVKTFTTNNMGNYVVPNLPAGTYKVTFSYPGFITEIKTAVIKANTTTTLNLSLGKRN